MGVLLEAAEAAEELARTGEDMGDEADATSAAGTTLDATLDPNPARCGVGFGRPAAVLLAEGDAAMAEAILTRLGVKGAEAAEEEDDAPDDAAEGDAAAAVSATVLVFSGVPNDVPPTAALDG